MHPMLNIALKAARRAGDLIVRSRDRVDYLDVTEKGINDFATEVDIQAEELIIQTIKEAYPDHAIMGEESGEQGDSETVWIIDPLDGTTNYIHGFPHVAVSIAVQHKGVMEHGIVYDPLRQELFTATRGGGARLNNRRIRVSTRKVLTHSLLGIGFPFRDKQLWPAYFDIFETLFKQAAGIRRTGSAALDLAYVAAGRLDGFWDFGLKPWDLAAGTLLIKEAGGLVSDFEGSENYMASGNVVTANSKLFKLLLQIIRPAVKQSTDS